MDQPAPVLDGSLVITGCGILSPIGIGFDQFAHGFASGHPGRSPVSNTDGSDIPYTETCWISEFEVSSFLGKKGTRFFDRTTGLVIAATGLALENSGLTITDENRQAVGTVMGCTSGSLKSIFDYCHDTLTQDRPHMVDAMLFPNQVMNSAAGQSSIWHKFRGINANVSAGQVSSLMALRYASLAIRQGYSETLLVGGVEEKCPQSAWAQYHTTRLHKLDDAPLPGEGCAVFVVETAAVAQSKGRKPIAELLACEVSTNGNFESEAGLADELSFCIERALQKSGVKADEIWVVSSGIYGDALTDRAERSAIERALHRMPDPHLKLKHQVGECFSAAGAIQLAGLLAQLQSAAGPRHGLVTAVGYDGTVGCAVIRGCIS